MRDLELYLSPEAEHLWDWFHVAMRLTVLQQTAKGLPDQTRDDEEDYPLRDVESTVNQVISKRFCKKQQMQWTPRGAHLLLQMRVKTLNHELATVFRRWYPDFPVQQGEARAA